MRKNKIIVYPLMIFLSLLNGVNYSNDIFQVLKKDRINHIQMDSDKIIRMLSGKLSPLSGELDASDVEKFKNPMKY